jgi:hypothetical protein
MQQVKETLEDTIFFTLSLYFFSGNIQLKTDKKPLLKNPFKAVHNEILPIPRFC